MRKVIVAAVILDRSLLLVKKNQTWIVPGGKPQNGESDLECLAREFKEELSGTKLEENIAYYGNFPGKAPHAGDTVDVRVYLARIDGEVYGPSAEISEAKFVRDFDNYNLSESSRKIIESLKRSELL